MRKDLAQGFLTDAAQGMRPGSPTRKVVRERQEAGMQRARQRTYRRGCRRDQGRTAGFGLLQQNLDHTPPCTSSREHERGRSEVGYLPVEVMVDDVGSRGGQRGDVPSQEDALGGFWLASWLDFRPLVTHVMSVGSCAVCVARAAILPARMSEETLLRPSIRVSRTEWVNEMTVGP